jgi:hypothetical protein
MEAWGDLGKRLAAWEDLGKPNSQNRKLKSAGQRDKIRKTSPCGQKYSIDSASDVP